MKIHENYVSRLQVIARTLRNHVLFERLSTHDQMYIERVISDREYCRSCKFFLNFKFPEIDTNVSLDIHDSYRVSAATFVEGDDGNTYITNAELDVSVNYPCHGKASGEMVIRRAEVMIEVANLANIIEKTFCDDELTMLVSTKEEKLERQTARDSAEELAKYRAARSKAIKGLRVGKHNTEIAPGVDDRITHEYFTDVKTYEISVFNGLMYVKRTA